MEEFVQDHRFRSWVKNPSPEEDSIWQNWIGENPHKIEAIEEARSIILSVHPVDEVSISDKEIRDEISNIISKIHALEQAEEEVDERKSRGFVSWLKVAASVSILLLGGWYAIDYAVTMNEDLSDQVASSDNYMIERVNRSVDTLLISLPDNSSVLLSQNSLIRYPRQFTGDSRNVFLEGAAFFEVTKDPENPFYVDVGNIVAKVLGTSFEISTNSFEGEVRVVVKSGAVSIYANPEQYRKDPTREPNVILTKNEKAVFKDDSKEIHHTRLDSLAIRGLKVPDTYLKFRGTPVEEVFRTLAGVYGVTIDFSNARTKGCSVTASFTDEPFALKLDLICRSVGLKYTIANDYVTITGNGCND